MDRRRILSNHVKSLESPVKKRKTEAVIHHSPEASGEVMPVISVSYYSTLKILN